MSSCFAIVLENNIPGNTNASIRGFVLSPYDLSWVCPGVYVVDGCIRFVEVVIIYGVCGAMHTIYCAYILDLLSAVPAVPASIAVSRTSKLLRAPSVRVLGTSEATCTACLEGSGGEVGPLPTARHRRECQCTERHKRRNHCNTF